MCRVWLFVWGAPKEACMCRVKTHCAQYLVTLSDDILDLFQHVHLHILQLLLLSGGISNASAVCGLSLLCLGSTQFYATVLILSGQKVRLIFYKQQH